MSVVNVHIYAYTTDKKLILYLFLQKLTAQHIDGAEFFQPPGLTCLCVSRMQNNTGLQVSLLMYKNKRRVQHQPWQTEILGCNADAAHVEIGATLSLFNL